MKIVKFVFAILICQLAGLMGAIFNLNSIDGWYTTIAKPVFNPPNWIFGPVWTILFILMGISLYLIWTNKHHFFAMKIFGLQLFLNILWSFLFFGLQNPFAAFIGIVLLWISILLMIIQFYKVNRWSALLNIPYLLWVTFALVLNLAIVILN
ncbi:tryptophan-rich sensory protein [Candidatus Falkowbacteria bacterium]|jgi:translocator protein|nr:tryptophan-rich sensory protein [Candidatus Falkowbacteria bacterium]MBT7007264.1 tryptophan-rich sensory protein [Candidatus Falkowbacteria bacterium]